MDEIVNPASWVKDRANCSIGVVFEELKREVQADVADREALRPKTEVHGHYCFKFTSGDRSFAAFVDGALMNHKAVLFSLNNSHISIEKKNGDRQETIKASVTLNDKARCVLRIGEKEYEHWQIRKMALDDLFFSEY
jgi:hypothetical protein